MRQHCAPEQALVLHSQDKPDSLFVAVDFLVNHFVPASFIVALFSAGNAFAVPLAAIIGLPLSVATEASIPLVGSLLSAGASQGATLAFMTTGAATSAWIVAGIATFMKGKVIALYVFFMLVGGVLCGYEFDLLATIAAAAA